MTDRPFVIPVFLPHMGCPHRCVFCDQHAIACEAGDRVSLGGIKDEIERFLSFPMAVRTGAEIAFYGGNFLGLPLDLRQALLTVAQAFVDDGRVDGIRFSTRPETITERSIGSLGPYRVTTIEVGVQSLDDRVLVTCRRGHTAEDARRAVKILHEWGGRIGLQLMPGLPGDTPSSIMATGRAAVALSPDIVRIYPTLVIRGTVLEEWYRSGRFQPLSLDAAVNVTKGLYLLFHNRGISVVRMGLHPGDTLRQEGNVVAGPFHPAFGHLVHSAVFLDRIVHRLEAWGELSRRVSLQVHPAELSRAIGERRGNIGLIKERFGLESLMVTADPALFRGEIRVATG